MVPGITAPVGAAWSRSAGCTSCDTQQTAGGPLFSAYAPGSSLNSQGGYSRDIGRGGAVYLAWAITSTQANKKDQSQRFHPLGESSALVLSTLALCDIHDVSALALSAVQPQPRGLHVRRRFLKFVPESGGQAFRAKNISVLHWEYFISFWAALQGLFPLFLKVCLIFH